MIKITKEFQNEIEELLVNKPQMNKDSDLSNKELISHIITQDDAKKRFGVLYERITSNTETNTERKVFGNNISKEDAELLAVHFIIEQENETSMIEHGDAIVTEKLNYFALEDGELIEGYFKIL